MHAGNQMSRRQAVCRCVSPESEPAALTYQQRDEQQVMVIDEGQDLACMLCLSRFAALDDHTQRVGVVRQEAKRQAGEYA